MLSPDAFKVLQSALKKNRKLSPAARAAATQKLAKIQAAHRRACEDALIMDSWLSFGDTSGFDWRLIRLLHKRG